MMNGKDRKGAAQIAMVLFVGALLVIAVAAVVMVFSPDGTASSFKDKIGNNDNTGDIGVPVESLTVSQINEHTLATEGSNDIEFWDSGADIADSSLSARETLTLSSGTVTDTSLSNLLSGDSPSTKDLYVDGASAYYDRKVSEWDIAYNEQTGKGVLQTADHTSGAVKAVDVGTFADMDSGIEAVDTGFGDQADGTVNYSISAGDGTAYIRVKLGNDEVDSEIMDAVLCISDDDSDLEGNEIDSLTVSKYSGDGIGSIASDLTDLFNQAAGTGAKSCTAVGDIVGQKTGTYEFAFTINEGNFEANEEFEIAMDDLGAWKARQYPSSNLKASAEDLTVARVA